MRLYIYIRNYSILILYIYVLNHHLLISQIYSIKVFQYNIIQLNIQISYKMHFLRFFNTRHPPSQKRETMTPCRSLQRTTRIHRHIRIHIHNTYTQCDTDILNLHSKTLKRVLRFIQRFNHDIFKSVLIQFYVRLVETPNISIYIVFKLMIKDSSRLQTSA